MKKMTQAEITALLWQDMAKIMNERAEQLLRVTADEQEMHLELELAGQWLRDSAREAAERLALSSE
ncbi:MAG TPA: hypothetical protein VJ301_18835 [Propionibacteriaceae bacterium]|nr:hypothetical protein [Propionibacteriaceae bacterium]